MAALPLRPPQPLISPVSATWAGQAIGQSVARASARGSCNVLSSGAAVAAPAAVLGTFAAGLLYVAGMRGVRRPPRSRYTKPLRVPCRSAATGTVYVEPEDQLKNELLDLCGTGGAGKSRVEVAQRVEDIVAELERRACRRGISEDVALMEGRWRLLTTFVPGQAAAEFFSLDSWREYVFEKGPSPVQAAIFTNDFAQRVYQVIDFASAPGRWHNVVDARPYAVACIQADIDLETSETPAGTALRFQWTGGFISFQRPPWASEDLLEPVKLPYPVPFKLLGDRARGTFDTVYLDHDLRIARGSKSNSVFVLAREDERLPLEEEYYTPLV